MVDSEQLNKVHFTEDENEVIWVVLGGGEEGQN